MAELVAGSFLSSFFDAICGILVSVDFIDYFRRGKLEELVEKLEYTLNSINQVLDDAEEKQYKRQDVKKWLGEVKHVAYEVDQLLDEMATNAPLKKLKAESNFIFPSFIPTFTNPFASRIKDLLKSLVSLANEKDMLGLQTGTCARYKVGLSPKPSEGLPTVSLVESDIYGREGDKKEIISLLLSEENDDGNQVPVISIVGLGGMGKTTLAKLVYNDPEIKEEFDLRAWVYVSESYDVVRLTKAILRSFEFLVEGEDLDLLQRQLQQKLMGKKYLLVMDDVWNANWKIWEQLLLPFNHKSSGSKIVVTTRDKGVASNMKSARIHHLKELNESKCWELFVRHAFPRKNVSQYPNLVSIGKRIVVKCGGLPLAIKALANLLHRKFSQSEWVKILETDMWCLLDGDGNINPVLRLSYHNLPSNLKRCFAYCSIFPKGYKFDKDEIIKLWMADGLLKCCGTEKSEEELGNELFNDLESISFFQKLLYTRSNNKYHFVMHDLVNDLAKSVSGEACIRIGVDRGQHIERTRHIWCSIDLKDGERKLEHVYKTKGLRSLMVKTRGKGGQCFKICKNVQHELFSRLKHLRMLSFNGCFLSELADEIGNLQLLRYLNLSDTGITSLPDSICKLYNLQTLILVNCRLDELPSDFYKLVNLCHLDLRRKSAYYYSEDTSTKKMPKHIGKLNHLQMLTHFVVGEQSGSDIKELETLNHLRGTLHITGLENVINPADAATANLKDKKYLEKLYMAYSIIVMGDNGEMDDSIIETLAFVLEALQPNDNLNGLIIDYYPGKRFPSWFGGCHLPTLVSLDLRGCKFCTHLPPLGQLPSLKELLISSCDGIEIVGEEFYGDNNSLAVAFRSLEILKFEYLLRWKEWLCPDGCFPSLISLSIKSCHKLKGALPQHLPSLQKLKICGCEELEVSIPKAANIKELQLENCENILINEIPSSLKKAILVRTGVIESSLEQIVLNNSFLENLSVEEFDGANLELSSLDLLSCNSFQSLSITRWGSSPCLPFALHSFTNLNHLNLYNCPHLESFPRGGLPPNLNSLWIQKCPKLIASREEWGLFQLNSLKEFNVSDDFENVESFPEESLLPPTLNSLFLRGCSKLRVVNYRGLLHLKSLKHFSVIGCPCLERFPEEGLPDSLSALTIYDCSLLKQRYQKEGGELWHTISHIPTVTIDF